MCHSDWACSQVGIAKKRGASAEERLLRGKTSRYELEDAQRPQEHLPVPVSTLALPVSCKPSPARHGVSWTRRTPFCNRMTLIYHVVITSGYTLHHSSDSTSSAPRLERDLVGLSGNSIRSHSTQSGGDASMHMTHCVLKI